MGKLFNEITAELAAWIGQQHLFFVATAPLFGSGLVNCSPKGMDTFRIVGPKEVAYLDLTGSGIETAAHLQENGRIVFMFCAFVGPPKIVRLHGIGEVLIPTDSAFKELQPHFPDYPGVRAIIRASLSRISDSCGYGVPNYDYVGERDHLIRWVNSKGSDGLTKYRRESNVKSLDGLPGLECED